MWKAKNVLVLEVVNVVCQVQAHSTHTCNVHRQGSKSVYYYSVVNGLEITASIVASFTRPQ